ncbi:MAG: DNA polymerase III subunit gamma/tau [Atopobiaceae bacterium]|nr:DNA polymerase III subunit gamma/tau [Atopobiaceae bacterium]
MESLYRKYRPQTFADVVGQQHVVGTLQRAVVEGRTSHAYLFCGPRGTGKTTMARLLAKSLMCEQGPGSVPDGTCEQCRMIADGEHPDVYELDAASRTGVDNVREEIINRVGYAPVRGRYKVYIIDEVHMLTTAAFNALLKTLEEPPGHVVFVLCTTDPQKIPATILSRVQRFDFRPIGNDDIRGRLAYVCGEEGFAYDDAALDLVVRHARGGMRDALSTLEQLSVFGDGKISTEAAQDLLGAVPGDELTHVVEALAARDVPMLFLQVGEIIESGRDPLQFARDLAAHVRDVYVAAVVGARPEVLGAGTDAARLQAEAQAFGSPDRLARMLTLLGDVVREMATAPNQRLVLEIAFTRMARPEEDLTLESLAERLAEVERRLAAGVPQAAASQTRASQTSSWRANTQQSGASHATAPHVTAPHAGAPQAGARETDVRRSPAQQLPTQQANAASQQQAAVASQTANRPSNASDSQRPQPAASAARPTGEQSASAGQGTAQTSGSQPAMQQPEGSQVSGRQPAARRPDGAQATGRQQPVQQSAHNRSSAPQPSATSTQSPVSAPVLDPGELQRRWRQAVGELVARIPRWGSLLSNATPVSDDGTTLTVSLPKGSGFALKMLEKPDVRAAVEAAAASQFGPRTMVFREGLGSAPQGYGAQPVAQPAAPSQTNAGGYPAQVQQRPGQQRPGQQNGSFQQPGQQQPNQQNGSFQQPGQRPGQNGQQQSGWQQPGAPQQYGSTSGFAPAQQYGSTPAGGSQVTAAYPMPWDDPNAMAGAQSFADDRVPYEEMGDAGFADEPGYEYPSASQPVQQTYATSQSAPTSSAHKTSGPASASSTEQSAGTRTSASGASHSASGPVSSQSAPTSAPAVPASRQAASGSSQAASSLPEAPDDLPADLAAILANAFEVFGNDVRVSRG